MKILWVSDPPIAPTAYGQQTGLFVPRLRAAGHDVSILGTGIGAVQRLPDGTLLLPVVSDRYGNSIVASHAKVLGVDLVITLMDPHALDPAVYATLPWCAWAPLDFETPAKATLRALKAAKWVWSPSKHGADAYNKAGLKAVHVPHGVDSQVFDIQDRAEARQMLSVAINTELPDDTFLVVAVAANRGTPSRKGFFEMLSAWKFFTDAFPSARLYLHTEPSGLGGIGENIFDVMELVGLAQDKVIFPPQYHLLCGALGPEHLATAYNAADVYLSTSHGEGFGVPCFPPGSRVTIGSGGVKPIEQIAVGDMVITHTGKLKQVLAVGKKHVQEDLVEAKIVGNDTTIKATWDHPILVIKSRGRRFNGIRRALLRGERPMWIPAGELERDDLVCVPRRQSNSTHRNHMLLGDVIGIKGEYITSKFRNHGASKTTARMVAERAGTSVYTARRVLGGYETFGYTLATKIDVLKAAKDLNYKRTKPVPSFLPLNKDSGFVFGQYIAEGCTGSNGQIDFASHNKELAVRSRLSNALYRLWGLESYIQKCKRGGLGARLIVTCKPLANAIGKLCGNGAHNKHLPPFVFDNLNFAEALLIGAWIGDGCFSNLRPTYSTVSEQLAYELSSLLGLLGFHATIGLKIKEPKKCWVLGVHGSQTRDFLAMFKKHDRDKVQRLRVLEWDGHWWAPVRNVEKRAYAGNVYNLEVADDNSYCVERFAVHNCVEAQLCGCPVIVPDNTAQTELCLLDEHLVDTTPYMPFDGASVWKRPHSGDIQTALLTIMGEQRPLKLRQKAIVYDIDTVVAERMLPELDKIAKELAK